MLLSYRTIRPRQDRETLLHFYRETQIASVGYAPEFDEEDHLQRLEQKAALFPDGYVLALADGEPVGSMELRVKPYQGQDVGFVSILYLKPEYRGKGYSQEMFAYAERFFRGLGMKEYHLNVTHGNDRALRFYEKQGMSKIASEPNSMGYACWRMGKQLPALHLNEGVQRVLELSTSCRRACEGSES